LNRCPDIVVVFEARDAWQIVRADVVKNDTAKRLKRVRERFEGGNVSPTHHDQIV
jgi:hypothetical protein